MFHFHIYIYIPQRTNGGAHNIPRNCSCRFIPHMTIGIVGVLKRTGWLQWLGKRVEVIVSGVCLDLLLRKAVLCWLNGGCGAEHKMNSRC